jgi:hypothetical protein
MGMENTDFEYFSLRPVCPQTARDADRNKVMKEKSLRLMLQ